MSGIGNYLILDELPIDPSINTIAKATQMFISLNPKYRAT